MAQAACQGQRGQLPQAARRAQWTSRLLRAATHPAPVVASPSAQPLPSVSVSVSAAYAEGPVRTDGPSAGSRVRYGLTVGRSRAAAVGGQPQRPPPPAYHAERRAARAASEPSPRPSGRDPLAPEAQPPPVPANGQQLVAPPSAAAPPKAQLSVMQPAAGPRYRWHRAGASHGFNDAASAGAAISSNVGLHRSSAPEEGAGLAQGGLTMSAEVAPAAASGTTVTPARPADAPAPTRALPPAAARGPAPPVPGGPGQAQQRARPHGLVRSVKAPWSAPPHTAPAAPPAPPVDPTAQSRPQPQLDSARAGRPIGPAPHRPSAHSSPLGLSGTSGPGHPAGGPGRAQLPAGSPAGPALSTSSGAAAKGAAAAAPGQRAAPATAWAARASEPHGSKGPQHRQQNYYGPPAESKGVVSEAPLTPAKLMAALTSRATLRELAALLAAASSLMLTAVQLCGVLTTAERLATEGGGRAAGAGPCGATDALAQQRPGRQWGLLAAPCRPLSAPESAALSALVLRHAEVLADAYPPEMATALWAAARLRLPLPPAALDPMLEAIWLWDPADPTVNRQPEPLGADAAGSEDEPHAGGHRRSQGQGVMGPRELCLLLYGVSVLRPAYLRDHAGGFLEALDSYEVAAQAGPEQEEEPEGAGAEQPAGGLGLQPEQVASMVAALARAGARLDEVGQEFVLLAVSSRLATFSTAQLTAVLSAAHSWPPLGAAPGGLYGRIMGALLRRLDAEHERYLAVKQQLREAARRPQERARRGGEPGAGAVSNVGARASGQPAADDRTVARALAMAMRACVQPRGRTLLVQGSVLSVLLRQVRHRVAVLNARDVCEALRVLAELRQGGQQRFVVAWNEGLRALLGRWVSLLAGAHTRDGGGGSWSRDDDGGGSADAGGGARAATHSFAATLHAVWRLGVQLEPAETAVVLAAAAALAPRMGPADCCQVLAALAAGTAVDHAGAARGASPGAGPAPPLRAPEAAVQGQYGGGRTGQGAVLAGRAQRPSADAPEVGRDAQEWDGTWRWLHGSGVLRMGADGRWAARRVLEAAAAHLRPAGGSPPPHPPLQGAAGPARSAMHRPFVGSGPGFGPPRTDELACMVRAAAAVGMMPPPEWWERWAASARSLLLPPPSFPPPRPPQPQPHPHPQQQQQHHEQQHMGGTHLLQATPPSAQPVAGRSGMPPQAPPRPWGRPPLFSSAEAADILHSLARLGHAKEQQQQPKRAHARGATAGQRMRRRRAAQVPPAPSFPEAAAIEDAATREEIEAWNREPLPVPAAPVDRQLLLALLAAACRPPQPWAPPPVGPGAAAAGRQRVATRSVRPGKRRPSPGQRWQRPDWPPSPLGPLSAYHLSWSVWRLRLLSRAEARLWVPALAAAAPAALLVLTPRKQVLMLHNLARIFGAVGLALPHAVAAAWLDSFGAALAASVTQPWLCRIETLSYAAAAMAAARLEPPAGWMTAYRAAVRRRLAERGRRDVVGVREASALAAGLQLQRPRPPQHGDVGLARDLLRALRNKLSDGDPANTRPAGAAQGVAAVLSDAELLLGRRLCGVLTRGAAAAEPAAAAVEHPVLGAGAGPTRRAPGAPAAAAATPAHTTSAGEGGGSEAGEQAPARWSPLNLARRPQLAIRPAYRRVAQS